jgi:hypothetical protein
MCSTAALRNLHPTPLGFRFSIDGFYRDPRADSFFMRLRPIAWGDAESGTISTEAVKGAPRGFCKTYGLRQSATYRLSRVNEVDASILALDWCQRMELFIRIYLGQPMAHYVFSACDTSAYVETVAFTSLVARIGHDDFVAAKVEDIRSIVPSHPV